MFAITCYSTIFWANFESYTNFISLDKDDLIFVIDPKSRPRYAKILCKLGIGYVCTDDFIVI